jgi:chromosomal replication initiation ATPase DnaA
MPFDLGHQAEYAPEDFHVSACNHTAAGWVDKWPDWPAPALIVYGAEGSGKTHLSAVWRARSGAVENITKFAGKIPGLVLDDIDKRFTGKKADDEALFHLYNRAMTEGWKILMTASRPPAAWNMVLPDLKSRLLAAPAVEILPPDDALMSIVLSKLFSDRQVAVSSEVVAFLLPRMERSFAAARLLVEKIDHRALSAKRPVTIPLVREMLREDQGI